jgi:hypothetical protein
VKVNMCKFVIYKWRLRVPPPQKLIFQNEEKINLVSNQASHKLEYFEYDERSGRSTFLHARTLPLRWLVPD